jgi:hypothetical protein
MSHIISRIIHKPAAWRLSAVLLADGLLFGDTNAGSANSFVLISGFVLVIATIYQLARALIAAAGLYGLHSGRPRQLAASLTGLVSGLAALQSIGELSPRDVLVLLPLVVLAYLYSSFIRTRQRSAVT